MNDLESRDQIIADLSVKLMKAEVKIEELNELVSHVEEESGWRDCGALQAEVVKMKDWNYGLRARCEIADAEVARLKAHTWKQERAAVVAMLMNANAPLKSSVHYAGKIERGEHWPPAVGTP